MARESDDDSPRAQEPHESEQQDEQPLAPSALLFERCWPWRNRRHDWEGHVPCRRSSATREAPRHDARRRSCRDSSVTWGTVGPGRRIDGGADLSLSLLLERSHRLAVSGGDDCRAPRGLWRGASGEGFEEFLRGRKPLLRIL